MAADQHSEPVMNAEIRSPEFHLQILDDLVYEAEVGGAVPLASTPDNRYPFAYPRDIASITKAWLTASRADYQPESSRHNIIAAAKFMLDVQDGSGQWHQRYALDGSDEGFYIQEDNTAHGLRILAHAIEALQDSGELADNRDLTESICESVTNAVKFIQTELFDPNAHLIESTTSIHEGRIESGYTLWVNCAFISGLRQTQSALTSVPGASEETQNKLEKLLTILERGVERAFTSPQVVPRRYAPDGNIDTRPDVTLFAPFYYELEDLFGDTTISAAERAAKALQDPRLGGLQRFMGLYQDFEVQQHGGNGPWMQYTAWHAQLRYGLGEIKDGDEVLRTIEQYTDEEGRIPEHLTTRDRFDAFMEKEWHTRKDFDKEFDTEVVRDVPFGRIVEEAQNMRESYQRLADQLDEDEVVGFARPLAWSHAEVLTALLAREE